jgi:hypothetical protein
MNLPEFMVRVLLPPSHSYACCPSGDTTYEEAYNKAIQDVLPPGFVVKWPRVGHKWPVDSEGYTWVHLHCTGKCPGVLDEAGEATSRAFGPNPGSSRLNGL